MLDFNASEGAPDDWTETAVGYAERFGWHVVPLHPNPKVSEEDSDNPVVRLLGRSPLIDVPDDASAEPDVIRTWEGYPMASLAALTGTKSNLVAVELGPAAKRGVDQGNLKRLRTSLPETRCVQGPDREYYLFSIESHENGTLNLPRLVRSDGIILHGENSLIRIPGPTSRNGVRAFRWSLQGSEGLAPFPKELLSFFGIKTDVEGLISWTHQPNGTLNAHSEHRMSDGERRSSAPGRMRNGPSSSGSTSSSGRPSEDNNQGGGLVTFRSGEQLNGASDVDASRIGFPWLAEGALSLLCGSTKTAGKSTFVANLAAHLAAGRAFLAQDLQATSTVVLSDLPASQFQRLLAHIGIDREARSRLHVMHPGDARKASWQFVLKRTFDRAREVDAGLVIVDSLDHFVELKSGVDSRSNVDVVQMLTSDAPTECALLAVKALSTPSSRRIEDTLAQLDLLGKAADVVVKMETGPTDTHPTLRRLQFASRLEVVPSYVFCEMVRGRYQRADRMTREVGGASTDRVPKTVDGDGGQKEGVIQKSLKLDTDADANRDDDFAGRSGSRHSSIRKQLSEPQSET